MPPPPPPPPAGGRAVFIISFVTVRVNNLFSIIFPIGSSHIPFILANFGQYGKVGNSVKYVSAIFIAVSLYKSPIRFLAVPLSGSASISFNIFSGKPLNLPHFETKCLANSLTAGLSANCCCVIPPRCRFLRVLRRLRRLLCLRFVFILYYKQKKNG